MRLITLTTLFIIPLIGFASFPILPTEIDDISLVNLTYEDPWYISAKNAILFLASSIFGLSLFSVFVNEGFIVNDYEGSKILLLLPLILASAFFYGAIFLGKKIWGSSISNGDKKSKKMVFWTLGISIFLFFLLGLAGMGSGMGG
jgi:hypothetical protein